MSIKDARKAAEAQKPDFVFESAEGWGFDPGGWVSFRTLVEKGPEKLREAEDRLAKRHPA